MLYFHLHPNYTVLSKYYKFQNSVEQMYQYHKEGYDIVLDIYDSEEKVRILEDGFRRLTDKYGLTEQHDNIFFLSLGKVSEIDTILYELQWAYDIKKRTKELANLLLAFEDVTVKQLNGLSLKTFKTTAKINDSSLINFIGKLITNAIKGGKTPINLLEFNIDELFLDDAKTLCKQKLTVAASVPLVKPTSKLKSSLADFCFYLYPYLIEETSIKPDTKTLISDRLLNFYFDLLVLFQFVNPDFIESEPKDYMRSILMNHFKRLNTHYQGNKSNLK